MSILDTLRDMFTPITPDERALTPAQLWNTGQDAGFWTSLSSSDQTVTAATIMESVVGAALRLLADDISALPLDVFEKRDGEMVGVPLPSWLDSPTGQPWDTHTDLIADSVMSLHDGNIFYHCRPSTFDIQYIEVLDPTATGVEQDRQTGQRVYRNAEVSGAPLGPERIVHVPWLRLPGQLRGISPVQALKQSVGSERAATKWSGQFFGNGATLGGIISVPGGPETVDASALAAQFESRHSGEGKWWKPAVLTGGAAFNAMTPSPKDADLGPLYQHSVEVAARFFHIPPHLLASQLAGAVSYASVEQRSIEYVQHGIVPITTRIERILSRLVAGDDTYVKLNTNGLLRGDATARAEFYRTLADLKVIKPRQIAELEDLPLSEAVDGWHETPNNNGIPDRGSESAPERGLGLSLDARVDDSALQDLAERVDRLATPPAVPDYGPTLARILARIDEVEGRVDQRQAPEDIRVEGEYVYRRRGNEVIRQRIERDESGRVISVVAA